MNTVLWILQGLIAAMFAMAGFMKLSKSRNDLMKQKDMNWVESVSDGNLKIIGLLELLAALGLIRSAIDRYSSRLNTLCSLGIDPDNGWGHGTAP